MIHRLPLPRAAALAALALAGCSHRNDAAAGKAPVPTPLARAVGTGPAGGFEAARKDPPIAADTRFAAGQLAESQENYAQAAEQYQQAIKLDPKQTQAMFHLGRVYAEMKKYPEAIDVWKRYLKATGETAAAYSNLGFCYELAGRPEEAEGAYQRGIRKDALSVPCRVNYGLMLVRRGRVGEGKIQLGAVLKPAEVHYNVASVYESQGRREQAKAEYRQSLELDPQFADAAARLKELETAPAAAQLPTGLSRSE